jgi:N-acetylglutamate synthase-like GNAT family acetyltransferase
MYEIRLAHEADGKALVQFIDQHWKRDHIFVACKELLDWQHFDRMRERYNFVIGIERQTQTMHGVLGFIPLAQFDPEMEIGRLCWMAIWKVQDAARGHKLGRRLLSYLEDTIKPDILTTVAASTMTLPI